MSRSFSEDEVRKLIAEAVAPLLKRVAELEAENARLQAEVARLKKNSATSSKPPSSDIVKPPRPPQAQGRKGKRRRGGQPGHARHTRPPFPPAQIDETFLYEFTDPADLKNLKPLDEFRVIQQVELAKKLFTVTEHRARLYRRRDTGAIVAAPLPKEVVRAGLLGPEMTALIAYQKGACHMSYGTIRRFFGDVLHLPISAGELAKTIGKAADALAASHAELQAALPNQRMQHIDETGHPECGKRLWSWGFLAPGPQGFTWFHIDPSRSTAVLYEFLGETFSGIIGCDYFGVYRKFLDETDATMQFCWAHLIRDVKFLVTLPDPVTRRYGEKLLAKIKGLFRLWHRRGAMPPAKWQRAAERIRDAVWQRAKHAPPRSEAQNIAERFRSYGKYYFTFLHLPGVEPTNNGMERQMRFLAIDRKITQGTRGERGRHWCERIWTALATCAQQGRSAYTFLKQSMLSYFSGQETPSLLALPP
jgi:uncharacterized small protein (DUF1192 family)